MSRRLADLLAAFLLLCLAWPALAHAAAPVGLAALVLAAHAATHHLHGLLATAAVVAGLRAVPHPSARLIEALLGAWAVRVIFPGGVA